LTISDKLFNVGLSQDFGEQNLNKLVNTEWPKKVSPYWIINKSY